MGAQLITGEARAFAHATGGRMILKRVLVPSMAGLGTLALCLAVPVPDGPKTYEPRLFALVNRLANAAWFDETKKHTAFVLHALMHPVPHRSEPQTRAASETPAAPADQPVEPGRDLTGLREAVAFYKANDLAHGDEAAKTAKDDLVKLTLEWVALKTLPHDVGLARLQRFAAAHPDWPALAWIHHRAEEAIYAEHRDKAFVQAFFATSPPQTAFGKLALAQALSADGNVPEAQKLVRNLWRESELSSSLETKIRADFGNYLDKSDYKSRADHLLYKEEIGAAMRSALLAGKDVVALAQARAAVINEVASDKLMQKVPVPLKADPGFLFAEIQKLRRSDKIKEAVDVLLSAPRDPVQLVNGDEWWVERRLLARKVLDQGDTKLAYRLCAEHSAHSNEAKIEAEFHAGWIALRFMNDPALAAPHFAKVAEIAVTPMSRARAAYWQGRTAEATAAEDALTQANRFYEKAAAYPATYYGQLARVRLGLGLPLRPTAVEAPEDQRADAVRIVELLFAIGEKELATSLAAESVQHLQDREQIAALANIVAKQQDAHLALMIGKLAGHRGIALDQLAFPLYGIPDFEPLQNSAAKSVVYSVARQESAFDPKAASQAGAKGLMQMIASTAKRTAERAGLAFDENRLLSDPTFNAQLGAAHLGALIAEQGGSLILTFAAYNAGGKHVKEWIEAHGDPRSPGVDPIDWIERIPFTETRNYVQRVLENLAIYQTRFGETSTAATPENAKKTQAKL